MAQPENAFADTPAALAKGGTRAMLMKSGERWQCMNPACQCTVLVETSSEVEGSNPRCTCGSVMKKPYAPPVFRYLDFLSFPEPAITARGSHED
jgi:hypothetical protein